MLVKIRIVIVAFSELLEELVGLFQSPSIFKIDRLWFVLSIVYR